MLIAIAVVAIAIAVGVTVLRSGGSSNNFDSPQVYVFDLNASELTTGDVEDVPSVSESPGYAWASVFSCGECGGDEQFVGYLQQFDGELLQIIDGLTSRSRAEAFMAQYEGPREDHMIKRPGDDEWVPYDSSQGQAIRNEVMNECGGERPRP
ncbi:MAG: hypothetical protein ACOC3G_02740, partial [Phycisphaeraceae bacterium]